VKQLLHGNLQIWDFGRSDAEAANSATWMWRTLGSRPGLTIPNLAVSRDDTEDDNDVPPIRSELMLVSRFNLQTLRDAMHTVMSADDFTATHMPFMFGPSFTGDFQKAVYSILVLSGSIITDGYLAFLRLMTRYHASAHASLAAADMRRGAKGLQCLRNVAILQPHDAACVLLLGQVLFVFDILTDMFSSSAHAIVRSSLISAKQLFSMLVQEPALDTITICPVLIDTVECLVRRKVPIIRLDLKDRIVVDRYVGLCSTLLPLLYDLCYQSHSAKTTVGSRATQASCDEFADIEQSIRDWVPVLPSNFFSSYGDREVQMMMAQANAYHLAALLVIHRLRYPLGVQDTIGQRYANYILSELSSLPRSTPRSWVALPVIFPLMLVMLEVEGPGEELLEKLSNFTVQSICASKLRGFVKHVRVAKESGYGGLWFDLVEENLYFAVIP
jgi:hypothetical protein